VTVTWFTVTAFRRLAENAAASLEKGDRVIVQGRLRVRPWESGEKSGISVEIDADAIGHDLAWGTTVFSRSLSSSSAPPSEFDAAGAEVRPSGDALRTVRSEEDRDVPALAADAAPTPF